MGKLIRFLIVFITVLGIGVFFIYKLISPSWVYDLPNDYKIRKTSNSNVILGVEIDNDFYTSYQEKDVGIDDYVAEFQYNDNFVGVKTLQVEEENVKVLFYLVDTKEKEVHGPYFDEASYLAVVGVWSKKPLGDWITTTEAPDGAYFK